MGYGCVRGNANHLTRWQLSFRCFVSLGMMPLCITDADADENGTHSSRSASIDGKQWSEVGAIAQGQALKMLADQTQSNYEKIRTFDGTFEVEITQGLTKNHVNSTFGGNAALRQKVSFVSHVIIDLAANKVFFTLEKHRLQFFKEDTGAPVEVPNVSSQKGNSVVTPESYLSFDPEMRILGTDFLPNHPDTKNKRVVNRLVARDGWRQNSADLVDIRDFFGTSDARLKIWDQLRGYAKAWRGESKTLTQDQARSRIRLMKAVQPDKEDYLWTYPRLVGALKRV